jgi:hypothetical protein
MTESHVELGWAPQACTLPTAERPLRLAEFDALFSASANGSERLAAQHVRVTLRGDEDPGSVRDLAERETQCCSFFTFTVTTPHPDVVQLDIEVPASHVDVLDALASRAEANRSRR